MVFFPWKFYKLQVSSTLSNMSKFMFLMDTLYLFSKFNFSNSISLFLEWAIILHPLLANFSKIEKPIPLLVPVINANLFLNKYWLLKNSLIQIFFHYSGRITHCNDITWNISMNNRSHTQNTFFSNCNTLFQNCSNC